MQISLDTQKKVEWILYWWEYLSSNNQHCSGWNRI